MKSRKSRVLMVLAAMALVATLFGAGCGDPVDPVDPVDPDPGPVKVGLLAPLTGGISHWSTVHTGTRLAFDEVGWEVEGRTIQLFVENCFSWDPHLVMEAAEYLVETVGVDIIAGPIHSGNFLLTQPYFNEHEVVNLGLCYRGHYETFADGHPEGKMEPHWVFHTHGALAQGGYALGEYAFAFHEEEGQATCITVGADYGTGYAGTGSFADGFSAAGGNVTAMYWVGIGFTDWGPVVPDYTVADCAGLILYGSSMLSLIDAWYDDGRWDTQPLYLTTPCSVLEDDLADFGEWAEGLMSAHSFVRTQAPEFVDNFVDRWGRKPVFPDMWGYVTGLWVIHMLETTEGSTVNTELREAILDATLETPFGDFTFHSDFGWVEMPMHIIQAQIVSTDPLEFEWISIEQFIGGMPKVYGKLTPEDFPLE